jgi:phosphoserine phosphatase RsbU/P
MRSIFHSRTTAPPRQIEPVPTVFPKIDGLEIAAVFEGKRVAGDFYDCIRVSPDRVLFGLLDVSGCREDTRSHLVVAQEIFRNLGKNLFSPADINESDALSELCLRINRGLIDASKGVRACPAFIGCYHERFDTLCYTNAGHTPALLRDTSGIVELPSTGLPLGLFSHATCDAPTVGLKAGSSLLLVSRGVVESGADRDPPTEEFGLERVKRLLKEYATETAWQLCASVLKAVDAFGAGVRRCDDRTVLALVRAT